MRYERSYMKEPTGEIEAELDVYKEQIHYLMNEIDEYKNDLEIANLTILHLEGLVEQFKYQAFVNQKGTDDWK